MAVADNRSTSASQAGIDASVPEDYKKWYRAVAPLWSKVFKRSRELAKVGSYKSMDEVMVLCRGRVAAEKRPAR